MKKFINNQSGRSMVEMLGVLAIIGVLSVGGIAGYSMAMQKFRTNQAIEAVQLIAQEARSMFSSQDDYHSLSTTVAASIISNSGLPEPFDGIDIAPGATTAGAAGSEYFNITVANVPPAACVTLATSNWGTTGAGYVGVYQGTATTPSSATATIAPVSGAVDSSTDGVFATVAEASTACGSVNKNMTFRFK